MFQEVLNFINTNIQETRLKLKKLGWGEVDMTRKISKILIKKNTIKNIILNDHHKRNTF